MTLTVQDDKKKKSIDPFYQQAVRVDSLNKKIDRTTSKWDSVVILMKKKYHKSK